MPRLATIIICLILSVILGFFLLWPQYQKFSDERWRVKEKEAERNNQEEYFVHVESIANELLGYETELSKIASALPYSADIPALLNFLEKAAFRNGLILTKITSFSLGKPQSTSQSSQQQEESTISRAKDINIEFEVTGSYSALKNFISTLEKSARVIEVESIILKIKRGLEEGKEATPSFSLKIKTYYY